MADTVKELEVVESLCFLGRVLEECVVVELLRSMIVEISTEGVMHRYV